MFLRKEFVSFEFKDLSQEQEEDLFARVQMGVQLSVAEKMRASSGPFQELAKLFVDDFPTVYSLMKDRARAKDFQQTLSCFSQIIEVMNPSASDGIPLLRASYTALPKLLANKSVLNDGLKSHLASVWNTFKDLIEQDPDAFMNSSKYLRGVQTFAPIEMVGVAVLISMYADSRNNQLLLGDIRSMRESVREHFADLRMNPHVWKFLWEYIENLESIRGAVYGNTAQCRTQQSPGTGNTALVPHLPVALPPQSGTNMARATPKAKPLGILPPQQPSTVKEEEEEVGIATSALETHQPPSRKRRRTSVSPSSTPISAVQPPLTAAPNEHPVRQSASRSADFMAAPTQYHSTPTHSIASPTTSIAPQSYIPSMVSPPSISQPPAQQSSHNSPYPRVHGRTLSADQTSSTPSFTHSVPTASHHNQLLGHEWANQAHVPLGFSVPRPSMAPPAPAPSTSVPVHNTSTWAAPPTQAHQQRSLSNVSLLRNGAGEIRPISPQTVPATTEASPTIRMKQEPTTKPRKIRAPAQLDGAIDLTSDEDASDPPSDDKDKERETLLSVFGAKASAARQVQTASASTPTILVPRQALRQSVAQKPASGHDIPTRGNNSYARFKNSGDE